MGKAQTLTGLLTRRLKLPQITFYILKQESSLPGQAWYACRVVEKLITEHRPIYLCLATLEEAHDLDQRLWTFSDISFIPHQLYPSTSEITAPVIIGYPELPAPTPTTSLINLTDDFPANYGEFHQLIEVIPNQDSCKTKARERFRTYRSQGYSIQTFDISDSLPPTNRKSLNSN